MDWLNQTHKRTNCLEMALTSQRCVSAAQLTEAMHELNGPVSIDSEIFQLMLTLIILLLYPNNTSISLANMIAIASTHWINNMIPLEPGLQRL